MSKILIIEDDPEIRKIQKDYLLKENFLVTEASDGNQGLEKFENENPDLIILDLNLPYVNGIDVCKRIRLKSGVPIIMVTAKIKEIDELLGLKVGADDYLKKPFSLKILISRVKSLLKRPQLINQKILTINDIELNLKNRTLKKNGHSIPITTIQFNILSQLIQNPGKAFERYELIDQSYNTADLPDIFDRTMDSHIKNIRKLIEDDSKKPKYIITVRGIGYKFNENI